MNAFPTKANHIPAVLGLKKEGAMTAIPSAPICAAWRAWRENEHCEEGQ